MGLNPLDLTVLVVYLVGSVLIGLWVGRNQRGVSDYFLAGRNLPWWAICLSIVATETSTLTVIGVPAIAYSSNMTFLQLALGYFLGRLLVSFLLLPGYFEGRVETAYQVLENRFDPSVRRLAAALFQFNRALSDGVRLFATALVLSIILGVSDVTAILLIGLLTLIYTLYGGMRAVVWSDVIQLSVYLVGSLAALGFLLRWAPEGWMDRPDIVSKLQIIDLSIDFAIPFTLLGAVLGGAVLTLATHGTDHMMVQRYLSSGSLKASQGALILSGGIILVQFGLFLLIGVLLHLFYQSNSLPLAADQPDKIFPVFVITQMPPVLSGLIVAAIFAAAMSTLSSSLNSLAASSLIDFFRPSKGGKQSSRAELRQSRILTFVWATILILVAIVARGSESVLQLGLTLTSLIMGSLLGVFLLGQSKRTVRPAAAVLGMVLGLLAVFSLHLFQTVAWTWYVLAGTLVTYTAARASNRFWNTRVAT